MCRNANLPRAESPFRLCWMRTTRLRTANKSRKKSDGGGKQVHYEIHRAHEDGIPFARVFRGLNFSQRIMDSFDALTSIFDVL